MQISTNEAKQHSSGHQDKSEKKTTIHFNKSYPSRLAEPAWLALKPMERLAFNACLELAWRIDMNGSGKWLGCLRRRGHGPYSNLQLARAIGTSPPRASNHLKRLKQVGLLEDAVIEGERYLRVTNFPARMNGSFYEDFGRPWDDETTREIAQKAIQGNRGTGGVDCSESNSGVPGDCPESNRQGGVDCSESNSALTEVAGKAIDAGGGPEPGSRQGQALRGDLDGYIGADQICTYTDRREDTDSSSSDAVVGGCAASTADDEERVSMDGELTTSESTARGETQLSASHRPLNQKPRGGGAAASPDMCPAPPVPLSAQIRMRRFLTENMGVMEFRVDEVMSAEPSLTRLKQACHVAKQNCTSNLGAYLCTCLKSAGPPFWRQAAEGWEKERKRLQREVARALKQEPLGYEWRSWLTAEVLTEEAAYLYDLEGCLDEIAATGRIGEDEVGFASLLDSMYSMLEGRNVGRSDNAVIGGVPDYDGAPPVTRLLTNYGVPLTRAFLSIVQPETDADQSVAELPPAELEKAKRSSVERAPYPAFMDPCWADQLGVAMPTGNLDRSGHYLWLEPTSEEAVRLRQVVATRREEQERIELEREQREEQARQAHEEEQRLQQIKNRPKYEPLPDEIGTFCEEIGTLLNEEGLVAVLKTYGFSVTFEFLQKLFRREGLAKGDVEQLIVRTLDRVYVKKLKGLLDEMIEATRAHAPYPVWFTEHINSWWRMVMASRAHEWRLQAPTYEWKNMADYTSLKDLTDPYKAKQPDDPYQEQGSAEVRSF